MAHQLPPHDPLYEAVAAAGIPSGARILVAVSGGADSVALLDTLRALAQEPAHAFTLRVGHVNHCLRGAESDADEEFVRLLAEERALGLDVARVNTRGYAARQRLSLEVAARELRRARLGEMLETWGGNLLATGHTQDDQAETIVLRLLRGAGLLGLGGMQMQRGRVVRPLLLTRHATVLEALQARGQSYREDSSNRDLSFERNRVRWDVIPVLAKVQPRAVELISRTGRVLQTDADYVAREAERALEYLEIEQTDTALSASRAVWKALHPGLRRHVLRLLVRRVVGHARDLHEQHISTMESALEGEASNLRMESQLPHGLGLKMVAERFTLRRGDTAPTQGLEPAALDVPGEACIETGTLTASVRSPVDAEELKALRAVAGPYHALCDADRLGTHLLVRGRRSGDRVRVLGGAGSRKVQDLFVDRHVPEASRDRVAIVENGQHIVWIPGIALDERVAARDDSQRIVHLRFEPRGR